LLLFRGRDLLPVAYWRLPDRVAKVCNAVSLLYILFICCLFCRTSFSLFRTEARGFLHELLEVPGSLRSSLETRDVHVPGR